MANIGLFVSLPACPLKNPPILKNIVNQVVTSYKLFFTKGL